MSESRLLAAQNLTAFLSVLHEGLSYAEVQELLSPYGGPSTREGVYKLMRRGRLTSGNQLAYAAAFNLSIPARLHLQNLAGQAEGAPPLAGGER